MTPFIHDKTSFSNKPETTSVDKPYWKNGTKVDGFTSKADNSSDNISASLFKVTLGTIESLI